MTQPECTCNQLYNTPCKECTSYELETRKSKMTYDHECDGECVVCNKPTCEFCGQVSVYGVLACNEHIHQIEVEEYEEEIDDDEDSFEDEEE